MPASARLLTIDGVIEVAPQLALQRCIQDGLQRFGPLPSHAIASWAYYGRNPIRTRLGLRWQANDNQRSAARRALARLRHQGVVVIAGKSGRATLYGLAASPIGRSGASATLSEGLGA